MSLFKKNGNSIEAEIEGCKAIDPMELLKELEKKAKESIIKDMDKETREAFEKTEIANERKHRWHSKWMRLGTQKNKECLELTAEAFNKIADIYKELYFKIRDFEDNED